MFLQSPDSQMHGGLYPSLDVALSNMSPPPLGSSHEFVDGGANEQPSSVKPTLLKTPTRLGIVTPTFSACTVFLKLLGDVANITTAIRR
jgi:hypothetical protein